MTEGAEKIFGGTDKFYPHLRERRPKKRSSAQNLTLSLGVQSWFSFWNEISLTPGGHKQFFWGNTPQNELQWHRASYFLLGHNPRWGAQAVFWRARPQHVPPPPSWYQAGMALLIYSVLIQKVKVEAFTFTEQLVDLNFSHLISGQK